MILLSDKNHKMRKKQSRLRKKFEKKMPPLRLTVAIQDFDVVSLIKVVVGLVIIN